MQIIRTIKDMRAFHKILRTGNKSTGFVPTMGALHEGHLSLVRRSKEENGITVVSIFVNPTQFGPGEDFNRYPRDTVGDLEKLSALDVDAVFMPEDGEMYPETPPAVSIDVGGIGRILCGVSRPGHFNGVATVVAKLFNIVMPDRAYFGQKDLQQTVVIKKLVKELNFDVDIIICPVVREKDGLAMSSRNSYLNPEERKAATVLFRTLKLGEKLILNKGMDNTMDVKRKMEEMIRSEPLADPDYIEIVDPRNLQAMQDIRLPAALCIAARIGNTRLIDNIIIDKK
ncbi:MAG: pantoate--beta-alanine ligase [Deferribacteres bacterium]|nr:pantoate--beta-alanine ligase [Deferribacteres bacterium]